MGKPGSEGLGGLALRPVQTFPSDTEPGPAGDDMRETETHSPQSLLRKIHLFSGFRGKAITLFQNSLAAFIHFLFSTSGHDSSFIALHLDLWGLRLKS